jgi:hypothetical protein
MFRLPPDPGNPDAQAKGLAPQRASAAPSRGAGSFFEPKQPFGIVRHYAIRSRAAGSTNSRTPRRPTRRSIFVALRPDHWRAIRMSSGLHECVASA